MTFGSRKRRKFKMKSFMQSNSSKSILVVLAVAFVFSATALADGAGDFKAKCAMCHGADGTGSTPTGTALKVRDLSSANVQAQTDAQLTDIVTNGKGKMPAYKGKLTDDQIKGLVGFIRSLAKK
jgi:mono/diheme cytochrome c family protein